MMCAWTCGTLEVVTCEQNRAGWVGMGAHDCPAARPSCMAIFSAWPLKIFSTTFATFWTLRKRSVT